MLALQKPHLTVASRSLAAALLEGALARGLSAMRHYPARNQHSPKSRRPKGQNWALTQFWCSLNLSHNADQSGLKKVKLCASKHLTLNELELSDRPFCLSV